MFEYHANIDQNAIFLKDGTRFFKVHDEDVASKDVLFEFFNKLKEKSEEVGEPIESPEWEQFGPENEHFDPTDPFWIEF